MLLLEPLLPAAHRLALGLLRSRSDAEDAVRDAALIAACQHVEHYEIAGYGCARTFAQRLGMENAVRLLEETLEEEKAADQKLTEIAESQVNQEAEASGSKR